LRQISKKERAKKQVEAMLEFALDWASVDINRSEKTLEAAMRIWKKHNLRDYPTFKRYFYCHECKRMLIPGRSAKVRLRPGKVPRIIISCLKCGSKYKIPLAKSKRHTHQLLS
jgi:ribonuclease P protein subunit RPR2